MCFPLTGFSGGESSLDMSLSDCTESGSIVREREKKKTCFCGTLCKQTLHLVKNLVKIWKKFENSDFVLFLKNVHTLHTSKVPDNWIIGVTV